MIYPVRWLLIVCALCVSVRADFAQDLVRIHLEVSGGKDNVTALKAFKAKGVTRTDQGELRFLMWAERPNRIRTEVTSGSRTIAQGWAGQGEPWTADTQTRRISLLRGVAADEFKLDAEFDNPLLASAMGRKVSLDYAGNVVLDGRELIKLVVVQNFTVTSYAYLDPVSYMMVRRDIQRRRESGSVVVRTDYADFKAVAGVQLPHRMTVSVDGRRLNETVIEQIEPNPKVSDSLFKVLLNTE
jgi:hypothetical protein